MHAGGGDLDRKTYSNAPVFRAETGIQSGLVHPTACSRVFLVVAIVDPGTNRLSRPGQESSSADGCDYSGEFVELAQGLAFGQGRQA